MPEFFIECSIGGTTIVKVQAETLDAALEASANLIADDWNEAGVIRAWDIDQKNVSHEYVGDQFDRSIIVTDDGPMPAPGDINYEDEESPDGEVPTDDPAAG